MAALAEELIEEILIRLPVTSVLRFKTVSKQCCSLISPDHNEFAKRHLKQSSSTSKSIFFELDPSQKAILFQYSDVDTHKFNFPDEISKPCSVFGSANGLICVAPSYGKGCFLWNPLIGDCKIISPIEYFSGCRLSGFCYDSYSDDYKIVGVWTSHFAIFSLKNKSWTKREHTISFPSFTTPAIFSNGALHWFTGKSSDMKIVAFDSAKEKLFDIDIRRSLRSHYRSWRELLFDYRGSLCFFNGSSFWVMKEYGIANSWAKLDTKDVKLPAWISRAVHKKSQIEKLVGFLHTESLISPKYLGAKLIKDEEN